MNTLKSRSFTHTQVPVLTPKEWFLHPSNVHRIIKEVISINNVTKRFKADYILSRTPVWMQTFAKSYQHEWWEIYTENRIRIVKTANHAFLKKVQTVFGPEDITAGAYFANAHGEVKHHTQILADDIKNMDVRHTDALYENPKFLGIDDRGPLGFGATSGPFGIDYTMGSRHRIGGVYYPGQKFMHKRHFEEGDDGLQHFSAEQRPSGYNQMDLLRQSWAPFAD